jgi:iron complex outermembrane receptor protein
VTSGNANMVDTIALRSLTSDQTLILVNGKRRHTTSVITDATGPQNGVAPVDIGLIPVSSIDHIEILEDGAAAQYGSDAIAGVVNIILKHGDHGMTVHAINGGYYKGDGFTTGEDVSWGTRLGKNGFLDLGAEFRHQDHTNRGGVDTRVGQRLNQYFGSPQEQRAAVEYNAGYNLNDQVQLYSFGTYAHRTAYSFQYYRTPATLPEVFPAGFDPQSRITEDDFSLTGGIKGTGLGGWDWDLSTTYGADHSNFNLFDTVNTLLYADTGSTPTSFDVMAFKNSQWTTDLGFRRGFDVPLLAGPVNFAIGAQYRNDTYSVSPGEPDSYYGSGTQGQNGLSPTSYSNSSRDVTAGYVDLATTLLPRWQIDLAGRFEHYTDAGDTETGKISSRYDFNKYIAVRGTVSNGFRAPTLQEEHYTSLGTEPNGAEGVVAVDSVAARLLGAKPLKPERSTNFSAGVLINPLPAMHITVDAYQISIRDRIVEGGVYNGQTAIDALEAQGITIASNVIPDNVSAQYFSNGASTRTRGVDITAGYRTPFGPNGRYGRIDWDASANFSDTKVKRVGLDGNGNPLLSLQGIAYLSTSFPRNKLIAGGRWAHNRWDFALHEIRWGHAVSQLQYTEGANAYSNSTFYEFVDQPRFQTDVALGFQVTPRLHATLGANNLFNAYPSEVPSFTRTYGVELYDTGVEQIGINGGYYYLSLDFTL